MATRPNILHAVEIAVVTTYPSLSFEESEVNRMRSEHLSSVSFGLHNDGFATSPKLSAGISGRVQWEPMYRRRNNVHYTRDIFRERTVVYEDAHGQNSGHR